VKMDRVALEDYMPSEPQPRVSPAESPCRRVPSSLNYADLTPHSWAPCSGSEFSVRCGPAYADNRRKAGSASSIYEVFAVDTHNSEKKLPHIGRVTLLPDDPTAVEFGLPPYLILNAMVPQYPPPGVLGKRRCDGPSWQLTIYCRLSGEVRFQLQTGIAPAAVDLLRRFMHPQLGEGLRKERLKLIMGMTDCNAPGFNLVTRRVVQAYNFKPFLSKTASTFYSTQVRPPCTIALHTRRQVYPELCCCRTTLRLTWTCTTGVRRRSVLSIVSRCGFRQGGVRRGDVWECLLPP